MMLRLGLLVAAMAAASATLAAQTLPPALLEMAGAERAFAKMAVDQTPRDAFIAFFADESVSFVPDPGPARPRLRDNPNAFPPGLQLTWDPRVGDASAAGDLGYLTGPFESRIDGRPPQFGCYFSIWKRQPDGAYRVLIDMGVFLPGRPAFNDGVVRAGAVPAYRGPAAGAEAERSLLEADRALAAAVRTDPAAAYEAALHEAGRLHRSGTPLMTSRAGAVAWLRANAAAVTNEPLKAEAAASGDLGYTWGAYTHTPATGEASRGHYVRLWTRAADGRWRLAVDVTEAGR